MERYEGDLERDVSLVARDRLAERITGGLSNPGKMPEAAWGLRIHERTTCGFPLAGSSFPLTERSASGPTRPDPSRYQNSIGQQTVRLSGENSCNATSFC